MISTCGYVDNINSLLVVLVLATIPVTASKGSALIFTLRQREQCEEKIEPAMTLSALAPFSS